VARSITKAPKILIKAYVVPERVAKAVFYCADEMKRARRFWNIWLFLQLFGYLTRSISWFIYSFQVLIWKN